MTLSWFHSDDGHVGAVEGWSPTQEMAVIPAPDWDVKGQLAQQEAELRLLLDELESGWMAEAQAIEARALARLGEGQS